jgi:transglutaminase-like putative cysteine protease
MTGVGADVHTTLLARYERAAALALAAVTLATAVGFARVYDRGSFLPVMVATAAVTHGLALLGRRRRWSVPTTALVVAPVVGLLLLWFVFPHTAAFGLPTTETLDAVGHAVSDGWQEFRVTRAPVRPDAGFLLVSVLALSFAAFLADWAAFRLWSAFEAVVPTATLFVFCSAWGGGHHQVVSVAVYLTAVMAFLLLHRSAREVAGTVWLVDDGAGDTATRPGGAARAGAVLIGVAVLAGVLLGPLLPGAGLPARLPTIMPGGERRTVSPLVDLRDRLLAQRDVQLFTVRASDPSYWRLSSLDTFDGDSWKSQRNYAEVSGTLSGKVPESNRRQLEQTYTFSPTFDAVWAPAAFQAVRIIDSDAKLRYSDDLATLVVDGSDQLQGKRYTVLSALPDIDADRLRLVVNDRLPNGIAHYLDLPDDFSELARDTAEHVVRGKDGPFEKALALQQFFRAPGPQAFAYDTAFAYGEDQRAIDAFLTQRRGFCEQFAGTFAAMARSVGLPARVAVGFTPGVRAPADPTLFTVTGRQAHAWPEVYLGRYGWVAFEPTPGRGLPGAEAWTSVPAAQDVPDGLPDQSGTVPGVQPVPGTSVIPVNPAAPATTAVPVPVDPPPAAEPPPPEPEGLLDWLLVALGMLLFILGPPLLLAAVILTYVFVLGRLRRAHRRERRAAATDASKRVLVAWAESLEALHMVGITPRPSEAHNEFAWRIAPDLPNAGGDLLVLADAVDQAAYAPGVVADYVAADADRAAAAVAHEVEAMATPRQRWSDRIDPRRVRPAPSRAPHRQVTM